MYARPLWSWLAVGALCLVPASRAFQGAAVARGLAPARTAASDQRPSLRTGAARDLGRAHTPRRRVPLLRASASGGGEGQLIFSATSVLNGEVHVYELPQGGADPDAVVRSLWFSASPGVWQSAVQMRRVGDEVQPDWSVLPFPSSRAHAFASALVEQSTAGQEDADGSFAKSAMVLGLGGGTLAGWLLALPGLSTLTCSELDPHVQEAAASYFGLKDDDPRLTLQLGDGLEHAAQAKGEGKVFDLVAVDIGSSQSGDLTQMIAPPPSVRTKEALRTLCDVVAPGGVLSMTIVGGTDGAMLTLLQDLETALSESGGGSIFFFENRAAEKWLQSSSASIPARMAFALKSASSDSSDVSRGKREFMRARAMAFDNLFPPSPSTANVGGLGGMGPLAQRVRVELNDLSGLETRVKQQSIFDAMKPATSTPPPQASDKPGDAAAAPTGAAGLAGPSGSGQDEGRQAGWEKEKERAAQTKKNDAAYQAQLAAFRSNHPGVETLAADGGGAQAAGADGAASSEAAATGGGVPDGGSSMSAKEYQMWVYAQNNPGVSRLDQVRAASAPPSPPPPAPAPAQEKWTQAARGGGSQGSGGGTECDDEDEAMLEALAAEEEEIRRELAEFNRRQTSGEAATEETLGILTKAGIVPTADAPPSSSSPSVPPSSPTTPRGEASPAAAPEGAARGAPRRNQVSSVLSPLPPFSPSLSLSLSPSLYRVRSPSFTLLSSPLFLFTPSHSAPPPSSLNARSSTRYCIRAHPDTVGLPSMVCVGE